MPLKASFSQIRAASNNDSIFHDTLTVVGDKAYIIGGQTRQGKIAPNAIHCMALPVSNVAILKYQVLPAITNDKDGQRSFGIYFDCFTITWSQLPHTPAVITSAAISGDTLHVISSFDVLSSETISFPTNPLIPRPRSRSNSGLVPVTTGYGRNYLLYFFSDRQGSVEKGDLLQWSDLWTFQLPSGDLEAKATSSIAEAIKPAKIKDQIRTKLGADTGSSSWAEVEVQPPGDLQAHESKIHPGPRSSFGCDVTFDGRSVVLWGGSDAKAELEGNGWIIGLS
ncbi:hypothetical protein AAE478_008131 [Parahypoxylon ruwenzoriense]